MRAGYFISLAVGCSLGFISLKLQEANTTVFENVLPASVLLALRTPEKVELYSLEPETPSRGKEDNHHLQGVDILGSTTLSPENANGAIHEFVSAVDRWAGVSAACFDPRHALRITNNGHIYDLLLCYQCMGLEAYRDDTLLCEIGAAGSPKYLNDLLSAANVPLSNTAITEEQIQERTRHEQIVRHRWLDAMPKALRPLWSNEIENALSPDISPFSKALAKAYPDEQQRALVLYRWFGSGEGPWSGVPSYELIAEKLLLRIATPDLISAAETPDLTDAQLEGAARLFGGWEFYQERKGDIRLLPASLKKRLLEHSLQSQNKDNRERAEAAFAN